jgi:hypothetical protein
MTLQKQMRDAGYYTGPIDGQMGGKTLEAKRKFDEFQLEQGRINAAREGAAATKAAEDRQTKAAETAAETRRVGEERMRNAERDMPTVNKLIRDYGPTAGYVVGSIAGAMTRQGVLSKSADITQRAQTRADSLITGGARSDWPDRVGRVNQFWAEGAGMRRPQWMGGSSAEPFVRAEGRSPPFQANPGAPASSELYKPSTMNNLLIDAGVTGMYGGESLYAQEKMLPAAEKELAEARAAAAIDPSEANIARLQAAVTGKSIAEGLMNFGRVGAGTYAANSIFQQRDPRRPNTMAAEAERGRIDDYLNRRGPAGGGPGPRSGGALQSSPSQSAPVLTAPETRQLPAPRPEPGGAGGGAAAESRTASPRGKGPRQSSASSQSLPEGHKLDARGNIHGPNGRFTDKPKAPRSVQMDDTKPDGRE